MTATKTQLLYVTLLLLISFLVFNSTFAQTEIENSTSSSSTASTTTLPIATSTSSSTVDISSTTATSSNQVPEEKKEIRANNQNHNSSSETALNAEKQKRIVNLASNMSNRMDAVIVRFTKISLRLESRIDKLKLTNIDTTEAENKLRQARTTLETARKTISNIDTEVYNYTTSIQPKKDWLTVKKTFSTTADLLRQAQTELRTTIDSLKESPQITLIETLNINEESTGTTSTSTSASTADSTVE